MASAAPSLFVKHFAREASVLITAPAVQTNSSNLIFYGSIRAASGRDQGIQTGREWCDRVGLGFAMFGPHGQQTSPKIGLAKAP
jgi:hypothetical protein